MTAYLNALGVVCSLGTNQGEVARALFAGDCSGMRDEDGWVVGRRLPVAAVRSELPPIPSALAEHGSRNNQLLLAAALQIEDDIRQAISRLPRASMKPAVALRSICGTENSPPTMIINNRNSARQQTSWLRG